jgi:hypothetical protein
MFDFLLKTDQNELYTYIEKRMEVILLFCEYDIF